MIPLLLSTAVAATVDARLRPWMFGEPEQEAIAEWEARLQSYEAQAVFDAGVHRVPDDLPTLSNNLFYLHMPPDGAPRLEYTSITQDEAPKRVPWPLGSDGVLDGLWMASRDHARLLVARSDSSVLVYWYHTRARYACSFDTGQLSHDDTASRRVAIELGDDGTAKVHLVPVADGVIDPSRMAFVIDVSGGHPSEIDDYRYVGMYGGRCNVQAVAVRDDIELERAPGSVRSAPRRTAHAGASSFVGNSQEGLRWEAAALLDVSSFTFEVGWQGGAAGPTDGLSLLAAGHMTTPTADRLLGLVLRRSAINGDLVPGAVGRLQRRFDGAPILEGGAELLLGKPTIFGPTNVFEGYVGFGLRLPMGRTTLTPLAKMGIRVAPEHAPFHGWGGVELRVSTNVTQGPRWERRAAELAAEAK